MALRPIRIGLIGDRSDAVAHRKALKDRVPPIVVAFLRACLTGPTE